MIHGPLHKFGSIRVAEEAALANWPFEVRAILLEARSKVPTALPRKPGKGRRKQVTVSALDQKRDALLARADGIPGLALVPGDVAMLGVL
jgi:hypothetical protein